MFLLHDEDPWNDQEAFAKLGNALLLAIDVLNASIAVGISMQPVEDRKELPKRFETIARSKPYLHDDTMVGDGNEATPIIPPDKAEVNRTRSISTPNDDQTDVDFQTGHLESAIEQANTETEVGGSGYSSTGREKTEAGSGSMSPKYMGFDLLWKCAGPCSTSQGDYEELHLCGVCNDIAFCEKCILLMKKDEMPMRICARDHPHIKMFPVVEEAKRMTDSPLEKRFEVQQSWLESLKETWGI